MRTQTDSDKALLTAPNAARATYIKVEIDRTGSGAWVELNDWNGLDFVRAVRYREQVGSNAWAAVVRCALILQDSPTRVSLSPLVASSELNVGGTLIDCNKRIRISTSTVPIGDAPGTYNEVFLGRIDDWRLSDTEIEIACRDQTGHLQDRIIETEYEYGDDDPAGATANQLQEIIQNIIDDHYNIASDIAGTASAPRANDLSARTTDGSPVQLYSVNGTAATPWNAADNTGWSLRRFIATKRPVWQWLTQLAEQIGYWIHYRWHNGAGIDAFVLVLESPDRGSPSSVLTLDPTLGQCRVGGVSKSVVGIRNAWRVGWQEVGGSDDSVLVTDATSIGKYNRRYADVIDGTGSQIDSSTEGTLMANAFLNDTKEPVADIQVAVPYLWYLEANDIITINADNVKFDANQSLCIVGRENTIQQGGGAMTRLALNGTLQTLGPRKAQRTFAPTRKGFSLKSMTIMSRGGLIGNSDFGDVGNE